MDVNPVTKISLKNAHPIASPKHSLADGYTTCMRRCFKLHDSMLRTLPRARDVMSRPRGGWKTKSHFIGMASISSSSASRTMYTVRPVSLPALPELFNENFLDVLIPSKSDDVDIKVDNQPILSTPTNPMMDALKATANRTLTANSARAYSSTNSLTLDAFNGMSRYSFGLDVEKYLSNAWKEDPSLTLRIIWNLRSISDGKGEKETFYRAFGWLYDNHPRTAISNLHLLVKPVCVSKKQPKAHGYWKDLLNIVALVTVDQLSNTTTTSTFLHAPRIRSPYSSRPARRRRKKKAKPKIGTKESRMAAAQLSNQKEKAAAAARRQANHLVNYQRLLKKLSEPKFAALYIAVARLFAGQLVEDMAVVSQIENLEPGRNRIELLKEISLAAKWAPTPNRSHDRVTNISTAISELIYASQAFAPYPSALKNPLPAEERAGILRSFFQRWVLTELRNTTEIPETLMSSGRWKEIKYNRVASICMKNNTPHFFKHDPEGFEAYLTAVENNRRTISGATLMPHEFISQILTLHKQASYSATDPDPMKEFKQKSAKTQLRVIESQWKTLVESLRQAGSLENSVAICDVSASMGSLYYNRKAEVQPISVALSLSLLLATLAKPPFNGGFITFSHSPQYVQIDLTQPLVQQLLTMTMKNAVGWGMNTNLQAVFIDLLLPLSINNKIKQEDMIKRLFIFSDMQFDEAESASTSSWETNYDKIEQAYKKAGYEVPEIVYWDLSALDSRWRTVEVAGDRKGVAMMNGFSPAMLKVFMGESEEEDARMSEWESVDEEGNSVTVVEKEKEEFNPINVMKKALARSSFDGLVVVD